MHLAEYFGRLGSDESNPDVGLTAPATSKLDSLDPFQDEIQPFWLDDECAETCVLTSLDTIQ